MEAARGPQGRNLAFVLQVQSHALSLFAAQGELTHTSVLWGLGIP